MIVFISWSGGIARVVADALSEWLPGVLPYVRPWTSPQIEAGKVGVQEIMASLRAADIGIVVLTPESQCAPWVIFESGTFARNDVFIPYLVGLHPAGGIAAAIPEFPVSNGGS